MTIDLKGRKKKWKLSADVEKKWSKMYQQFPAFHKSKDISFKLKLATKKTLQFLSFEEDRNIGTMWTEISTQKCQECREMICDINI